MALSPCCSSLFYSFLLLFVCYCQYSVFSLSLPPAATFLQVWPHTGSCTVNLSQAKKGDLPCSLPVSTDVKVNLEDLNNQLRDPGTLSPPLSAAQIRGSLLFTRGVGFLLDCNHICSKENIYTG